jgi:hypothetical protein
MADDWYYAQSNERKGPVPFAKLRVMAKSGWLAPDDLVWQTTAVSDKRRHFTLTADDFLRLNPNTRTCPTFRSMADAITTCTPYRTRLSPPPADNSVRHAKTHFPDESGDASLQHDTLTHYRISRLTSHHARR